MVDLGNNPRFLQVQNSKSYDNQRILAVSIDGIAEKSAVSDQSERTIEAGHLVAEEKIRSARDFRVSVRAMVHSGLLWRTETIGWEKDGPSNLVGSSLLSHRRPTSFGVASFFFFSFFSFILSFFFLWSRLDIITHDLCLGPMVARSWTWSSSLAIAATDSSWT